MVKFFHLLVNLRKDNRRVSVDLLRVLRDLFLELVKPDFLLSVGAIREAVPERLRPLTLNRLALWSIRPFGPSGSDGHLH